MRHSLISPFPFPVRLCLTLFFSFSFSLSFSSFSFSSLFVFHSSVFCDFRYGGKFTGDFVISTPYVTSHAINQDTEFVVLACDGLFDVLTYQNVIDIARASLRKHGDVDVACRELIRRAMENNTTDNVSVSIVCLNQD